MAEDSDRPADDLVAELAARTRSTPLRPGIIARSKWMRLGLPEPEHRRPDLALVAHFEGGWKAKHTDTHVVRWGHDAHTFDPTPWSQWVCLDRRGAGGCDRGWALTNRSAERKALRHLRDHAGEDIPRGG